MRIRKPFELWHLLVFAVVVSTGCRSTSPSASDFEVEGVQISEFCHPDEAGHWPSGMTSLEKGDGENFYWAEGGGCVHRPLKEIWGVLHNIPYLIGIESGKIDRYKLDIRTPDAGTTTHRYEMVYEVDVLLSEVVWNMTWTHRLEKGSYESPTSVVVHYRRTGGSDMMPYWEGSFILTAVDDNVTAAVVHDEINSMRSSADTSAEAVKAFFEKLEEGKPDGEQMTKGLSAHHKPAK